MEATMVYPGCTFSCCHHNWNSWHFLCNLAGKRRKLSTAAHNFRCSQVLSTSLPEVDWFALFVVIWATGMLMYFNPNKKRLRDYVTGKERYFEIVFRLWEALVNKIAIEISRSPNPNCMYSSWISFVLCKKDMTFRKKLRY